MELFILRHGETSKRLSRSGGLDRSLTYTGTADIKNIANSIKKLKYKDRSSILVVGHEPYLSSMINDIISNSDTDRNYNKNHNNNIILKKAGLSRIKITSTVPKFKGELRWLLTPRILKKI